MATYKSAQEHLFPSERMEVKNLSPSAFGSRVPEVKLKIVPARELSYGSELSLLAAL